MSTVGFGDGLRLDLPTGRRQRRTPPGEGTVGLPVMMSEPVN